MNMTFFVSLKNSVSCIVNVVNVCMKNTSPGPWSGILCLCLPFTRTQYTLICQCCVFLEWQYQCVFACRRVIYIVCMFLCKGYVGKFDT